MRAQRASALQLVCEYLTDEWAKALLAEYGLQFPSGLSASADAAADARAKAAAAAAADTRPAYVRAAEEQDRLIELSTGGVKRSAAAAAGAAKGGAPALTMGQKKLAKVNIKGMKSMSSFFAKKPAVAK